MKPRNLSASIGKREDLGVYREAIRRILKA